MVPFEHQLKMGQSILRKSGNAYEKGTSHNDVPAFEREKD